MKRQNVIKIKDNKSGYMICMNYKHNDKFAGFVRGSSITEVQKQADKKIGNKYVLATKHNYIKPIRYTSYKTEYI